MTFQPVILLAFTGEGFGNRGDSGLSGIQYFPLYPAFRADLMLLSRGDQVILPFTGHQDFSVDFPERVSAPDFRQGIEGEFSRDQSAAAVTVQTAFNQFSKHQFNQADRDLSNIPSGRH
ncbi:hypothetical protein CRQ34_22255 [Salmonella enterica subsp. enterica serovar Livingstone]|nr:hypothetical protein [Salmonella enterica subsp. enterica serovar Livingstone]